jgi:hypothetical protein
VRLCIALVRACVDELERSLNEPYCAQGVALQLADALDNLARALRLGDRHEDETASRSPPPSADR